MSYADAPKYRIGQAVRTLSRSGRWVVTATDGRLILCRPEGEAWNRDERWFDVAEVVAGVPAE